MLLRRILKWTAILLGSLALLALLFVWIVLDVNPFEGPVDHPWSLVSTGVDFYAQLPGAQLLDEPIVEGLSDRVGFEDLSRLRSELARLARDVAKEVNPKIPLGLFQIDLRKDFLDREMAFGGTVVDYAHPKLAHFVAVARIPFYARFVSALRREWVRRAVFGPSDTVELRNRYFRVKLPPETVRALAPMRAVMARPEGDDALFFARVGDTLVVSDNPSWIADAVTMTETLPRDSEFDLEFMRAARGGRRLEVFLRANVPPGFFGTRGGAGGPLGAFVPPEALGATSVALFPAAEGVAQARLVSRPTPQGLALLNPYLKEVFDTEKGQVSQLLGADGLGRAIPRKRTVAAFAMRASAEHLLEILMQNMGADMARLLNETVRESSAGAYPYFSRMMQEIVKELGGTTLLVLHRPSYFETADYSSLTDPSYPPQLDGQLAWSFVVQVKESTPPDRIRSWLTEHLRFLYLEDAGVHPSGKFHVARKKGAPPEERLYVPAYGALSDGLRYVFFSTSVEAAEAILRAIGDPAESLLADPAVAGLVQRLPASATVAFVASPDMIKRAFKDKVREFARVQGLDKNYWMSDYRERARRAGKPEPKGEELQSAWQGYADSEYVLIKKRYDQSLSWFDAFEAVAGACTLGIGSEKRLSLDVFSALRPAGEIP